mgnify:CR=1 FL=1
MASVTFDHVYKRFGDVVAVNDLNIDIKDKEFLVLVGPSGCGKSTALRCLAGLEEISEGQIKIGDRVVNDIPPKDRDIALVFQSYALYPHMSVFDNMAFGLKLRKMDKEEIKRRVNDAAQILGIEELLDRKPRQLSGGQRQRVAIARALVAKPSIVLADEPTANLDHKTGESILQLMKRVNEAYAVLSNPEKRREYDAMRTRFGDRAYGEFRNAYTEKDIFSGSDVHQMFEEMARSFGLRGFDSIFSDFYGSGYQRFEFKGRGLHLMQHLGKQCLQAW